jgi:hypothetical protein
MRVYHSGPWVDVVRGAQDAPPQITLPRSENRDSEQTRGLDAEFVYCSIRATGHDPERHQDLLENERYDKIASLDINETS